MILSARILTDVGSVNSFRVVLNHEFTEGDASDVYLQLIDSTQDRDNKPQGRRYMPAAGATLSATVDNINDAQQVSRACSQPFANDPSIWKLTLFATDIIRGTSNIKLALTEGAAVKRGLLANVLLAYPASNV